jgi:DNA-binding FadR family transcriptional regulator
MIEPIQKRSLVDQVIAVVRHNIQTQLWKVNDKIPTETELVQGLGVGRNTIREAIKILEYLGILEVKQGHGTFVRSTHDFSSLIHSVQQSALYEHLEVRCVLEIEIAKLAARNRDATDMFNILGCLDTRAGTDASDVAQFMLNDKKLHLAIAQATHNQALYATYEYFLNSSYQYTFEMVTNTQLPDPDQSIHAELVEAIQAQSESQAVEIAKAMLDPLLLSVQSIDSSML